MIGAKSLANVTAFAHDGRPVANRDSAVFTWAGTILLAMLAVMLVLLPIDIANGPQYVPGLIGP